MRTDKKLWRNRKAKKELARRLQSDNPGLEVVHAHAAGIDVDLSLTTFSAEKTTGPSLISSGKVGTFAQF